MVTNQKEMYYKLQIEQLNITYKTNQVATAMHSHLSSLGWSPTNPKMVTHQKKVYYRLII